MILNTHDNKGVLVAAIQIKEANLSQADEMKAELLSLIDNKHKNILIDFARVEYVDSSFLGAMVSALKYAVSHKVDIGIIGLAKDIAELFALIRLDKVFKVYANEAEAVATITR